MKKLLQIVRRHNIVTALYRDENGNVCDKKYTKCVTNEEIRADICGVELKKEIDQNIVKEQPVEIVRHNQPFNTARSAKEEQAIKREKYIAFLNKIGVHEFDNERSFAKIESAYNQYISKKEK